MSVSNPRKTAAPAAIDCTGSATVTLGFDAAADLAANPADIVLIMDRSYSMNSSRMFYARQAARELIRTIADASAPMGSDTIGGGSRMAIVSFASEAAQDVPLTDDLVPLNNAITALSGSGNTNHRAAFEAAEVLLGAKGANRQIAVMFTDGLTTTGGDATPVTNRMKAAGVEIYSIGLLDDPAPLELWASLPLDAHVSYTSDQKALTELFQRVAAEIVIPGARDVVIREQVSPDFRITSVQPADVGAARITSPRELVWTVPSAGLTLEPQPLTLTFDITHVGETGGVKEFNESITYEDRAGSTLIFPSPSLNVSCGSGPVPPCPAPGIFTIPGCQDALRIRLDDEELEALGRILQLDVTVKAVCPGKRLAVSVLLYEIDSSCAAHPRGVRHLLVPAQTGEGCRDVTLRCISFSVPEALDPSGNTGNLCNAREFRVQVISNYVDTDFLPCEEEDAPFTGCTCPDCSCRGC